MYQKSAPEKWSRFMATVSGACVMGLTYLSSSILRFLLLVSFYLCLTPYIRWLRHNRESLSFDF